MVSIYDKNFRAFSLTGEKIEVLQSKKMKFRNAGYAELANEFGYTPLKTTFECDFFKFRNELINKNKS
jgi:hypothetical protein